MRTSMSGYLVIVNELEEAVRAEMMHKDVEKKVVAVTHARQQDSDALLDRALETPHAGAGS